MQISIPAFPDFGDCILYFRYFQILKTNFYPQSTGSLEFRRRLPPALCWVRDSTRFVQEVDLGTSITFLFPVSLRLPAAKFQHGGQFLTGLRLWITKFLRRRRTMRILTRVWAKYQQLLITHPWKTQTIGTGKTEKPYKQHTRIQCMWDFRFQIKPILSWIVDLHFRLYKINVARFMAFPSQTLHKSNTCLL